MPSTPPSLRELSPVLIANRGEIAVRVQRTVRSLGLRGAAIYADADRRARHAVEAELAAPVPSYLEIDAVLDAAARLGVRSVHPGYGFLSENAAFARAVADAGLVWIGPPAAAIELMGDKGRSKQLADEAGVPVIPGTGGEDASLEELERLGAEQGYPLMIKALAGGGGKGMRVVFEPAELESALAAARREAQAAFGDDRVLAERYVERPRHIEVQVLADRHGEIVHLGERECSLQRRHQKVIEEAPSVAVDAELRERMGAAAIDLTRACRYEGAGTVELIVPAGSSDFFFLEMNTRLQVEHPVTELVWGIDLVEQQLRVAAGERLALSQRELEPSGHAIEARLYAEDPRAGFLPATGTIRRWREPRIDGVRIDSGVAEGSEVGTDFDPLLAKVVAHASDRETAIGRLELALEGLELLGVANNGAFSRTLLGSEDFRAGRLDTGLLERLLEREERAAPRELELAGALALYADDVADLGVEPGPWRRRIEGVGEIRIAGSELVAGDRQMRFSLERGPDGTLLIELDGVRRRYVYLRDGDRLWIGAEGAQIELRLERAARAGEQASGGSLEAPMPGKVLAVEVEEGARVAAGDVLVVLESMKMELQVTAPTAGTIENLSLAVGDRVGQGEPLVAVVPSGEGAGDE